MTTVIKKESIIASGLKNPDIRRLADSAGVKSLDETIYEEIREILNEFSRDFLRKAALIMLADEHKILTTNHLEAALKIDGKGLVAVTKEGGVDTSYLEKCHLATFKGKKQFLKRIEYYQSHSDTLIFEKGPFKRFLKGIISKIETGILVLGIRVSPEFVLFSQFLCEYYISNIFRKANKCAIHAKRQTVQAKDLKLVFELGAD